MVNITGSRSDPDRSQKLFKKAEVIGLLEIEGATESNLTHGIGELYEERFQEAQIFHYPICTPDLDLGAYLVHVQEGMLMLPYNEVFTEGNEALETDKAILLDAELAQVMLHQLEAHTDALRDLLTACMTGLYEKGGN